MLIKVPEQEAQFINLLNNHLKGLFLESILAFYVIGSLARGGYSRECSDIDLLVVLKSPMVDLYLEKIDMFNEFISSNESPLADKISLFYGTIDSFNSGDERTRLPAYDKQDLKAHGLLISGNDIRDDIVTPSQDEILLEGVQAYFDYFNMKDVKKDVYDLKNMVIKKETKKLSKLILLPIRFLHSLYESSIATCENAVKSFLLRSNNINESELASFALVLRGDISTLDNFSTFYNPSETLKNIYVEFFKQYELKLGSLSQNELALKCTNAIKMF